jgi:uncharacterized protein (TIGR03663 family)
MSQRLLIVITWIGIALLALTLRLKDLEKRPLHADEATGARILAQQIAGNDYQFDPHHFHGPLLSWSSIPMALIRDEHHWDELSSITLRLGPAVAGILLIFTPLLWVRSIGPWGALTAAALLTSSPLLVYYNRMYIHESLLMLFAALSCAAIFRFIQQPSKRIGVFAGLSLGLMFATKETFAISILAWLPATYLCYRQQQIKVAEHLSSSYHRIYFVPVAVLVLTAALTAGYFYTNGFRAPQGIIDAVRTYFVYETTPGHEKKLLYYFELLIWPKHTVGTWWTEALIVLLAVIAVTKYLHTTAVRFLAVATICHFAIYSSIGYKTPWLMLVPWAHACLLAGYAFSQVHTINTRSRTILIVLLISGLVYQTKQSVDASGRLANDNRNPYAYVPTSKDAPAIEDWLIQLDALPSIPRLAPIAVVGQGYWPLPWYLRHFETIGYWPAPIQEMVDFPIIFAMPAHTHSCDDLLGTTHLKLPRSLRTNVTITLYLRNDIWQDWIHSDAP